MTTYKGEKYREEQLSSIEKSISEKNILEKNILEKNKFADVQIVVSDDGQDVEFLESLRERGKTYLPLKGPVCGAVANFEYALSHATEPIIFLSDQDDVWTTDKVEKVLKAFEDPECIMVLHDADLIDGKGEKIGDSFYAIRNSGSGIVKNIWKNSYIGCCMAFRKELLEYALPFPTKGTLHDQWLGLLAEQKGKVVFLEDKLLHYRRHEENVSGMQHLPVVTMLYNRMSLCWNLMKRMIRGPRKYTAYTIEEVKTRWKH